MGGDTPVYNEKNILEVPPVLSFHGLPSELELWKVGRMQSYFPMGQVFFQPPEVLTSQ